MVRSADKARTMNMKDKNRGYFTTQEELVGSQAPAVKVSLEFNSSRNFFLVIF